MHINNNELFRGSTHDILISEPIEMFQAESVISWKSFTH